jgi:hypothetical protein
MSALRTLVKPASHPAADALAKRGDKWFFVGCLICGTWVFGPIGAPILIAGLVMLRQAEKAGALIRPWTVTVIGGLILVDASVNMLAWGVDMFPAHDTVLGRTLFTGYGLFGDGAYAAFYNTTHIGGVNISGEKGCQFAFVLFVMPIRIAAAWGLLKMKRWGLQWTIIANWLYIAIWACYVVLMSMDFPRRFGISQLGVLGFWLEGGLPFLGPVVLLPYLHSVNRECWSE